MIHIITALLACILEGMIDRSGLFSKLISTNVPFNVDIFRGKNVKLLFWRWSIVRLEHSAIEWGNDTKAFSFR